MGTIRLGISEGGEPLVANVDKLWSTRLLLQSISGSRKTSMLETIVKRIDKMFYEENGYTVQKIIVDWEGEYASRMRPDADYIVVGNKGEFPMIVESAKSLGRITRQMYVSVILDMSSFGSFDQREEFVRDFTIAFLDVDEKQYRKPCIFVVEEGHNFSPQSRTAISSDAMRLLVETGRKRKIMPIFVTQRIAEIDKDVSAQLANRIIGLTVELSDRQRAVKMLGVSQSEMDKLARLEAGQFYAFGIAISGHMVKFTLDNEKPPDDYEEIPPISQNYLNYVKVLRDKIKVSSKSNDSELKDEISKLRTKIFLLQKTNITDEKVRGIEKASYARGWEDCMSYFKSVISKRKSIMPWKEKPIEFVKKKVNGLLISVVKDDDK